MQKIFILLFLSYALSMSAQEPDCSIIYTKNMAFMVTAPEGWVSNCEVAQSMGLALALYPLGTQWETAEAVMYINTASLKIQNQETLKDLIQIDTDHFMKGYPDIEIKDLETMYLENQKKCVVKSFGGGKYGNYEQIAYLDEGKTAVMFVISSRTNSGLKQNVGAFLDLLKSYKVISNHVIIEE